MKSSSTPVMTCRAMTRRRWLAASAAASLAAYLAPLRSLAGSAPARVLLLGDSMIAGALGLYLERNLRDQHQYVVHRHGKSSTGLARPDFYNWETQGRAQVEEFRPDAVVTMFGGNDGQGLHMGRKAEPQWIRWNEPQWEEEYSRRMRAFCDAVAPPERALLWIGMPVVRPKKMHDRMQVINRIYQEVLAGRGPKARFLETWSVLANPAGEYVDRIAISGKRTLVRAGDGVHLTRRGARHLADHLTPQIVGSLA
ncbi:MAG: DUF459 domain-containing protein [Myxococcales bacterium FL481]|nr:MAG: DUF459 domain-containing protein [Myxococcales bacterium FL481]